MYPLTMKALVVIFLSTLAITGAFGARDYSERDRINHIGSFPARVRFGSLPKGFVPPTGPSQGTDTPPPAKPNGEIIGTLPARGRFGSLPKGFVPPSGPSQGTDTPPPPAKPNSEVIGTLPARGHFGCLPKGFVPLSGPSQRTDTPLNLI